MGTSPGLEHRHLGRVGVAAGDPVAEVGQGGRRRQAHVADPDDRHRAALAVRQHPDRRAAVAERATGRAVAPVGQVAPVALGHQSAGRALRAWRRSATSWFRPVFTDSWSLSLMVSSASWSLSLMVSSAIWPFSMSARRRLSESPSTCIAPAQHRRGTVVPIASARPHEPSAGTGATGTSPCRHQSRTSRSRASVHSGSKGSPDSRSAALSSRELAGRGAGRGGSSSAVAMGSTRSGSWPAAASIGPGEAEPGGLALVGHVEGARPAVERQADHGPGQVGGEGRARRAGRRRSAAEPRVGGGQAQDGLDHVGAVGAAHPGRPDHGGRGAGEASDLGLAAQLAAPVDRARVRAGPTRRRAGRGCRRRRSRSRRRPGGPRSGAPPRPCCGCRGR